MIVTVQVIQMLLLLLLLQVMVMKMVLADQAAGRLMLQHEVLKSRRSGRIGVVDDHQLVMMR